MTETDTWLTLGEAVAATGWKPERIRSLARRGTMPRRRGNGRDWLYQVMPELVAERAAGKDALLAELRTQIEREIARGDTLAAQLAEARRPWWQRWIARASG
jgi:hypothetical protein